MMPCTIGKLENLQRREKPGLKEYPPHLRNKVILPWGTGKGISSLSGKVRKFSGKEGFKQVGRKKLQINRAREDMVKLGIYKPEFEPIIEIYSQLREQYEILTTRFVKSGYKYSELTETGTKKAPIVTTLEALRKDILSYASQLGLTPQGLLKTDENAFKKKKVSAIAAAMREASG
jgi:hypothetical protein